MTISRKYLASVLVGGALLLSGCSASITEASAAPSSSPSVPVSSPSLPESSPSLPVATPPGPVSSASGSAPALSADACGAFANLKTSISDLGSIDIGAGGLASIQTKVDAIRDNLDAFQSAASTAFGPQITVLRTSIDNVQISLSAAGASPSVSTVAKVALSIAGVVGSFRTLRTAVSSACG
jgi:hypothetical protein